MTLIDLLNGYETRNDRKPDGVQNSIYFSMLDKFGVEKLFCIHDFLYLGKVDPTFTQWCDDNLEMPGNIVKEFVTDQELEQFEDFRKLKQNRRE